MLLEASMTPSDRSALDADYVAALRHDMMKFAILQLRNDVLAEDVVQEALAAAFAGIGEFSGRSKLKTWVFSILRNKIIDQIRHQTRTTNVSALSPQEAGLDEAFENLFRDNHHWNPAARPKDWGSPEESLREQRFWDVFDICLKNLPDNTARVFMMREFLEFETSEVCKELSITSTNCNVILHRARNALRLCLNEKWFSAGELPC